MVLEHAYLRRLSQVDFERAAVCAVRLRHHRTPNFDLCEWMIVNAARWRRYASAPPHRLWLAHHADLTTALICQARRKLGIGELIDESQQSDRFDAAIKIAALLRSPSLAEEIEAMGETPATDNIDRVLQAIRLGIG